MYRLLNVGEEIISSDEIYISGWTYVHISIGSIVEASTLPIRRKIILEEIVDFI